MKSIWAAALIAAVAAGPTLANAQEESTARRAGVREQMQQLADAGYRGGADETTYPRDVEAAQRRIDPLSAKAGTLADTSGYGEQTGSHSESGARRPNGPQSLYFGS
jgi:cytochrome c556